MKELSLRFFNLILLIVVMFGVLGSGVAAADQAADPRIDKLEAQLQQLQAEIAALKAARVKEAKKPVVTMDQKQVQAAVEKILAERPRPELGPTDFRVFWKEGLRFESQDGDFKLKIGGRIMTDFGWISEDRDLKADFVPTGNGTARGDQQDGVEVRRARLYISGLIYGNVEYKLQFDFTGGDADLKDAYIGLTDLPFGRIRAGHFKEPFSLEELTSSKYVTFIERALPVDTFAPSRNIGVMVFDTFLDKSATWAAGIFRETDDNGNVNDDGAYSITGRMTALPWYENKGASLLHVGAAYSHKNPKANSARYSAEPETHMFSSFVDTNSVGSDQVDLLGLEAAWVSGPLSVQGEYIYADIDRRAGASTARLNGYYVQTSYFLTGEHRKYKQSSGTFGRVKPKRNFSSGDGLGAWEVAARYSALDLDDSDVTGGKLKDATLGVNWYLNPNVRLMWNYIHATKEHIGNADILLMRLQIDF